MAPEVHLIDGRFLEKCSDLDKRAIGKPEKERSEPSPMEDMSADAWRVASAARMLEQSAERLGETVFARNDALCREAYLAGGLLANSLVTREQVLEAFLPAMTENGYLDSHAGGDESEVERIIDAQLKAGVREPFDPTGDELDFDDDEPIQNNMSVAALLGEIETNLAPEVPEVSLLESAASLEGVTVPSREWMVPDLIPHRTVTILGGDGGTGKSLLALQLAVATAVGVEWLGRIVARPGPVVIISAEDERDELHRRLASVCDAEGVPFSNLPHLFFRSLAGEGAILADLDRRSGKMRPTKLFKTLNTAVAEISPSLVILDTLADLHSGDQNDQSHARQFITLLRGLCVHHGCTVLLLAHPSLTGITSGTGTGGSMAWNNSVRSRLYIRRIKENSQEADPDARLLETMKSNYGKVGGEIRLRWKAGTFHPYTAEDDTEMQYRAEKVFLKLLRKMDDQGRRVSHKPGANYAPKLFSGQPEAKGTTKRMLQVAMEAMLSDQRLEITEEGPPSKRRQHLRQGSFGFD